MLHTTTPHRLTTAQALVRFLTSQYVERDGQELPFFAGCFGIFGHGNIGGVAQALHQYRSEFRYILGRNEQAMVHAAAGFARMHNRLRAFACTTSIGPGATNLVTGAAGATINRLPVLLLPADMPASRSPRPVLQQIEQPWSATVSVNDALRPVSKYWDRLERPEQLLWSAMEAMRVLTDQAETGAVTLALPTDVQAEAHEFPAEFFRKRVWHIPRQAPDPDTLQRAAQLIHSARRPLIVCGGGVIYSEASAALQRLVDVTGIPIAETHAGKGSLPYDHPANVGALGVNGTPGAFELASQSDLVIGLGTRWTDVTTISQTVFPRPDVRFINVNVASFDAHKLSGLPLVGDAWAVLEALQELLSDYRVPDDYRRRAAELNSRWDTEVDRYYSLDNHPLPSQGEVVGAVNAAAAPRDVVVCAAGSMPNDLHKLWRSRDPKSYHVEYGYSCMGYEIPGGMGVKLAAPDREVFVMVGDGSYLMMPSEIATAVQEGVKLIIVLVENRGFASVGALSRRLGMDGFGTAYRFRSESGELDGAELPIDLAANAASLGARVIKAATLAQLRDALEAAKASPTTTVVHVMTDPGVGVPRFFWWDVAVAEVSESEAVQTARRSYEEAKRESRRFL
ncbi:MAG TPA: 3D-(3,5/4)-trihydroxycyclohexane-1,2-dione acylhydrolase (decyclizing) [Acidimicrobiia bacterium]|nr:3D-(3,5/4)-trihydroxycyclohexane-1,2-dione acylhydrolase (decyclizing) [Acidimicrobiia bacterium]